MILSFVAGTSGGAAGALGGGGKDGILAIFYPPLK